jgi:hypothetical protein
LKGHLSAITFFNSLIYQPQKFPFRLVDLIPQQTLGPHAGLNFDTLCDGAGLTDHVWSLDEMRATLPAPSEAWFSRRSGKRRHSHAENYKGQEGD